MKFVNFSDKSIVIGRCVLIICFIPLYFVLDANNQYWQLIPTSTSVKIYIVFLLALLASVFVLQYFFQIQKATLITSWLAFNYLFFFKIFISLSSVGFLAGLRQYKYYLPILSVFVVFVVFFIVRLRPKATTKFSFFIFILFVILNAIELCKSIINKIKITDQPVALVNHVELKKTKSIVKPDVFLIVMDEYAGFRSLNELNGYDNSAFAKKLRSLGFFVAKNPSANYNGTLFSTLSLNGY